MAVADVFTVDTNKSSITLSGSIDLLGSAYSLEAQGPGSLTTAYGGTVQVSQAGSTIQFTPSSLIQALDSGDWQPESDGSAGSAAANYGGQVSVLGQTITVAVRDVLLEATSPAISVAGGQFDSSSLVFGFSTNAAGVLSYNAGFLGSGATPLSGYATNNVSALATLATVGAQQTLTIPVGATFHFSLFSQNDTTLGVQGQFVAVRSAAAPLAIQAIEVKNQMVTLEWQSSPGEFFQVLSSTNLAAWQTNAINVSSTTTSYTWSGPATARQAFYRIAN
jgi:hypothetical protein